LPAVRTFDGHEAHSWLRRGVGNCFGVKSIAFIPFDDWFDVLRGYEQRRVPRPFNLSRPIMSAADGFHCDNASTILLKETWQFGSRRLVAENLVPVFVHSVDLEGLFGEVQTNR
jgi:hypothetical protein